MWHVLKLDCTPTNRSSAIRYFDRSYNRNIRQNNFRFHTTPTSIVSTCVYFSKSSCLSARSRSQFTWLKLLCRKMKSTPLSASVSRKGEDCYGFIFLEECCVSGLWQVMGVFTWKYACHVMSVLALGNEPLTPIAPAYSYVSRILCNC